MKIVKRTLLALFALLIVAVIGLTVYMFNVSLKTKVKPTDEADAYAYLFEHEYLKNWVDSLNQCAALKDTFILSDDNVKLHALYVRSAQQSPNTAVIVHGYTDNAIRMLMIGHLYNKEMGYNIILPDLRAHGKSGGEYIQMGWKDRLDIVRWMDVAKGIYGDSTQMVVHGISMGGATTMMTSGEQLPDNVKCFVEDCGYTSVWDEYSYKLKLEFGLPQFPILYTTSFYTKLKEGWSYKEASSLEQVKKSTKPMFFIHGESDKYVPTTMVHQLYDAKQGEKELWIAPKSEHARAYWDHTDQYVSKVKAFVDKYINQK